MAEGNSPDDFDYEDDDRSDVGLGDIDEPPLTESEQLLHRAMDIIQSARPVPLSTSAMINRDEVLGLIEHALETFPAELRQSRWLLKERSDFIERAKDDADKILAEARSRAGRMVERSELVKAADSRAKQIVADAEAAARRQRLEAEDFCDQKLGSFEIILERTMRMVGAGRERLQSRSLDLAEEAFDSNDAPRARDELFDQDEG